MTGSMSESDDYLLVARSKRDLLTPSQVAEVYFWLLIEISPIHSEKVIQALKDFLVLGYTRREVCERHGVSAGYFSVSLARLQQVSRTVSQLVPYYTTQGK